MAKKNHDPIGMALVWLGIALVVMAAGVDTISRQQVLFCHFAPKIARLLQNRGYAKLLC